MRIESITLSRLSIPFRFAFEHASAKRKRTETLWARVETDDGSCGHGEACPRTYVSGESIESALAFFERHRKSVLEIREVSDLRSWVEQRRADIDASPAAWCALELAILDALGRSSGRSVESLLGLEELAGEFRYTAVLGVQDRGSFRSVLSRYRELRMTEFKLKLSGNLDEDRERLRILRSEGEVGTLRLDANNLWDSGEVAARHLESLGGGFLAVEEPLTPNRYGELARLASRVGVLVVLDESFLRARQLEEIPESKGVFVLNVRVSKMGGLLRSIDVVRTARRAGFAVVVGAQVGETSLLARAALPAAREAAGILVGQEGAFGDRLLIEDLARPPLTFGNGGVLRAPVPGAGFGLALTESSRFLSPLG
jgi:L-alanine-DL-glutamate epimerase-like enolase superfamily enzyme